MRDRTIARTIIRLTATKIACWMRRLRISRFDLCLFLAILNLHNLHGQQLYSLKFYQFWRPIERALKYSHTLPMMKPMIEKAFDRKYSFLIQVSFNRVCHGGVDSRYN